MKQVNETELISALNYLLGNIRDINHKDYNRSSKNKLLVDSEVEIQRLINVIRTGEEPIAFNKIEKIKKDDYIYKLK